MSCSDEYRGSARSGAGKKSAARNDTAGSDVLRSGRRRVEINAFSRDHIAAANPKSARESGSLREDSKGDPKLTKSLLYPRRDLRVFQVLKPERTGLGIRRERPEGVPGLEGGGGRGRSGVPRKRGDEGVRRVSRRADRPGYRRPEWRCLEQKRLWRRRLPRGPRSNGENGRGWKRSDRSPARARRREAPGGGQDWRPQKPESPRAPRWRRGRAK